MQGATGNEAAIKVQGELCGWRLVCVGGQKSSLLNFLKNNGLLDECGDKVIKMSKKYKLIVFIC